MKKAKKPFNEDFLQFVWKFQLFDKQALLTNDHQTVQVIKAGTQNFGSGPDFLNARIKIGNSIWAGNVEIHYSSIEWKQHGHDKDPAYNNVILHVLYQKETKNVFTCNQQQIPSISLAQRLFNDTLDKYRKLLVNSPQFVPCENLLSNEHTTLFTQFYDRLVVQRLERKINEIEQDLVYTKGSIDDAFLIAIFKYFGAPKNKDVFGILARNVSLKQLISQTTSVQQMEALLFGLSDLLYGQDEYAKNLENEYEFLKRKFKLNKAVSTSQWHFARLRPLNFPTVRIAQLAALLVKEQRIFNFIQQNSVTEIRSLFAVSASPYWLNHYRFGIESREIAKRLNNAFINKLLINVVAPFLFYYGQLQQQQDKIDYAINLLMELPPESNRVISNWRKLNVPIDSAMDTQGLLQLHSNYCCTNGCLDCNIGYALLKKNKK